MTGEVELTWSEFVTAAHVGLMRQADVLERGRTGSLPTPLSWLEQTSRNILGAVGELAVARLTGRYWSPSVGTFKSVGDVGPLEVRTRRDPAHELIVRERDKLDRWYVLVVGEPPKMTVVGAILGSTCLDHPEWRRDHGGHGPAYFVPHSALVPPPSIERAS